MIDHMHRIDTMPSKVHFIYSSKVGKEHTAGQVLSLQRLVDISQTRGGQLELHLFFTGGSEVQYIQEAPYRGIAQSRRLKSNDLEPLLENVETNKSTICYVCGPPAMTDELVDFLQNQPGLEQARVLCEKWW